ncbi:PD-(D/E)XK nuclease family protein [Helicobacter pylori]|uniref:PDDEXK-like family protein n=1 Tax=Helicobacter pylori TaxID=210 RepID=UPI00165BE8CC|nr:PD-(D/E)XK nuclease family protein [Helicobacter pylori]WQS20782.1 PD-(D/E)XK nuclease family protein [Helicobacter pylori]WQS30123.1 PD-(D/E)XK nuclease family protein [Helicobacter pylori]
MSDYQTFFNKVKHALKELEIKRARGLHDYNVFSVLMSESDEVKHSKILHSFLDPMGGHYQKDLFLKVFLKVCDLESFGFNSADTKIVKKEVITNGSKRMDLFLSDGFKHIILENKIYAGDCDNQISDYILGVVKDYQVNDAQNICVLYLTKEGRLPSQNSLGDFKLDESNTKLFYKGNDEYIRKLENLERGILFKNLCYEREIKEWINKCLEEVANLHDLSVIFKQYEKLLDKLYHKERQVNKDLRELIENNYKMAEEISKHFDVIKKEREAEINAEKGEKVVAFLAQVKEQIEQKMSADDRAKWVVSSSCTAQDFNKKYVGCLEIKQDDGKIQFFLETENLNVYFGITGRQALKGKHKQIKEDLKLDNFTTTEWWLDWWWLSKKLGGSDNFADNVINGTWSVEKFSQAILDYFNKHKELAEKLNANMDKYIEK